MKTIQKTALIWALSAGTALAQTNSGVPQNLDDLVKTFQAWMNFGIKLFWTLAILSGFWAAFTYLRAQGSEEEAAKAKKIILYTVIAAAVALLATGIQPIVTSILSAR